MARKGRQKLLWAVLWLIVLTVLGGLAAVRLGRHRFSPPEAVATNVQRVRNLFVDVYGVRVGKQIVLIDAGIDEEGHGVDALLGALSAKREDVTDIFLTHGHVDHIAAVKLFDKAKIHAGGRDADMMRHKELIAPRPAILLSWILPTTLVHITPIDEAANIKLGDGAVVKAFPLPGHTGGSFAYLCEGVLFVGDAMHISKGKLGFAWPVVSVDRAANRTAIVELQKMLSGTKVRVVCTGHSGCTAENETSRQLDELFAQAR